MAWNNKSLNELLSDSSTGYNWTVATEEHCIIISSEDEIDVFGVITEHQIIFESILFENNIVANTSELNEFILRSHQLAPLTSVGIKSIDGTDYYIAFGSLSIDSKPEVIQEEVAMLLANIEQFIGAFQPYLKGV